jgi:lipopolysaccharide biosynthesis protein
MHSATRSPLPGTDDQHQLRRHGRLAAELAFDGSHYARRMNSTGVANPSSSSTQSSQPSTISPAAGVPRREDVPGAGVQTGPSGERARLIAFYLPQFHPIPENDAWWGKGFTEWTNVAKAKPFFRGHLQPRLPSDLGYYDLRLPEAREAQAELAKAHGVHGFCYWHYWFNGRRLLERPFAEVLASGKPDFPFCLAWANETWSRTWLGDDRQILIEQTYSDADDVAHARWLATAFADSRYIRVHGRPLFLVYRPHKIPDPRRTTDNLRREVTRLGLPEPFLVGVNAHNYHCDMRDLGFDLTEHHEPQLSILPGAFGNSAMEIVKAKLKRKLLGGPKKVYDFDYARKWMDRIRPSYPHFPGYFVGWDNTARRGERAVVIHGATPEKVEAGLRRLIERESHKAWDERIIFINAWNEWAEGMYLEPDQHHGRAMLEAFARAARGVNA